MAPARSVPRTLRIALDYRPALFTRSGIGRATRELAIALARRDDLDPHLFGHGLRWARTPGPAPLGTTLHRTPLPGRLMPVLARAGWTADRMCGAPTVFHWTDYVHPPLGNTCAVLTLHDLAFAENPAWHGTEQSAVLLERTRAASACAALVITPSSTTAQEAHQVLRLEPAKVRVIPFGADHVPTFPLRHPLDGRPFLLALGTIEPRKNHLLLLDALDRLGAHRPLLVVAGAPGWESAATTAAVRRAEAAGTVRWLRTPTDATVFALLAHAQALVYPSLQEGFGFPPLEAMALGTPVVCSDLPVLEELSAGAALSCDPHSADSLADSLAHLLADRELREDLCRRGRERARAFRWADCAAAHAQVYREAAR